MVNDRKKTKDQLIREISELRQRIAALEESEAEYRRTEEARSLTKMKSGRADSVSEQRVRDANNFCQMGARLQTCETLDEAYKTIQQFGPDLFPAMTGGLFVSSGLRKNMETLASWGGDLQSARSFPPEHCQAFIHGQAVFSESAPGTRCKHINPSFSGSYLDAPIIASGEIIGLLHLESRFKTYDRKVEELALIVAEHLALSLSNLKLRETLSEESVRDPLTGLFNRRYMEESLAQELARASRAKYPVSLLKLAVDDFEHFNDAFGRDGSDLLLKELGALIQQQVRRGDIFCRLAGESFVLILPSAKPEFAVKRAQGFREAVKSLNLASRGQLLGPVTISVGVSAYPDHGTSADELLRMADQALSHAKAKGRDTVEFAGNINNED